jgi:hypothetical protein
VSLRSQIHPIWLPVRRVLTSASLSGRAGVAGRWRATIGPLILTMTLSPPSLRRFVRRALVDATGAASPDPAQLASAFDLLCERLRRQLKPLFGAAAANALFVRAVHVAAAEFSWLREVLPSDTDPCASDRIASVEAPAIETVEEGLAAVLAHNIGLLNTFLGEDLVLPLVQQAWGVIDTPRTGGEP